MALFLLGCLLAAYAVDINFGKKNGIATHTEKGILGGPAASLFVPEEILGVRLAFAESMPEIVAGNFSEEMAPGPIVTEGMLQPPPEAIFGGGAFITYAVKRGDTLSRIGRDFGVSVQTLVSSNPELKGKALRIGQELLVPPVSGIVYRASDGETPESVASTFGISVNQLQEFNRSVDFTKFGSGTVVVIPGAHSFSSSMAGAGLGMNSALPGYFILPAEGFNFGKLHEHNAVDIANSCGTPVVAAAEGLVSEMSNEAWSGGYGHYVLIEHPNGTKTRYAHLKATDVSIGDYLKQGDHLGTMGDTGEATGCHLHLEVEGAKNPFAR